jgi:chromosome segregation ATPase
LETQLADLQNELDDAMRDRVPRAEWLQMQNQLQATQAEVARLQQALDAAEARPDLKPDLDKVKRERDLLSAQNKTLNAKLAESETSLENSRATQLELQQERDNLAASLAAEQEQRQQLEQDIASLQAGLAEAEAAGITPEALTSVQQLLETMQQENEELKTKVAEQQTTVDTLMQERSEDEKVRDRKVRELQGMLGQQLEALAEANQQIAQLERSQSELEKVRMERTRLEQRQQKNRKDMQTLASHIYELREKVAAGEKVEMELAREVNRSNQLTASLQEVKQELSSLQRLQEVLGEEKARRDDQLRELRQQLRLREEREKSLQEEKEALQKELERLNTSSRDN